jgi:hypothetical protein
MSELKPSGESVGVNQVWGRLGDLCRLWEICGIVSVRGIGKIAKIFREHYTTLCRGFVGAKSPMFMLCTDMRDTQKQTLGSAMYKKKYKFSIRVARAGGLLY